MRLGPRAAGGDGPQRRARARSAPTGLPRMLAAPLRLGAGAATMVRGNRRPLARPAGARRRARRPSHGPSSTAAAERSRARCADELGVGPGRGARGDVPQPPRLHRAGPRRLAARRRPAAAQHRLPGPQLAQVLERERPAVAVLDEEFSGAFDAAGFEGGRVIAWRDGDGPGPTINSLIRRQAEPPGRLAGDPRPGPRRDPHLGHDRDPEGRAARPLASPRSSGR